MTTQLQQDFDAYWASAKPGDVNQVGDLTYTMGTGGQATVTGPGGYTQTFRSSTNPAALANNTAVQQSYQTNYGVTATPPGGQQQLQQDLDAFKTRQQTVGGMESADGFEFTTDPTTGRINVTTPSGITTSFRPGSTIETIADHIPELAYAWNQKYGTDFYVKPLSPTYWSNFAPQMQIGGVALQDMDPNNPARQRIDDLYRQVYGQSPLDTGTEWLPFNPNNVPGFDAVRSQFGENPYLQQQPTIAGPFSPGPVTSGGGGGGGYTPPAGGGDYTPPGGAGYTPPGGSGYTPTGGTGYTPTGGGYTPAGGGLLQQANIGEVSTYNPYTSEVEYNELVQNRMAEALQTPYAELQRKRALDEMNASGLLNSTLATQAANRASLDAALPIAQQDAATMTENRFRANDAINQALETNTGARNNMTKANMDALNAFGLDAQQFNQQRELTMSEHAQQMRLAEFDAAARERLTAMAIDSDEFMQANTLNQQDREFVINAAAANNELIMGAVSQIQQIEGLSAEQRAILMDEVGGIHYANLRMLQSLTGATIDWNSIGAGGSVTQEPSPGGEENTNRTIAGVPEDLYNRYAGPLGGGSM